MRIGILSDTHNLLRPEAKEALKGCDVILHAGDICEQKILDELQRIAPARAVRGNGDKEWAEHIPQSLDLQIAGLRFHMTHKKKDLPQELSPYDVVLFGHSHQYTEEKKGNTLLLNPGSCGPRRFHQPITLAVMEVNENREYTVQRIDIPHEKKEDIPAPAPGDMRKIIEGVVKETQKGKSTEDISKKLCIPPTLAEQIARLYVTHPGVTTEGIMAKMGL